MLPLLLAAAIYLPTLAGPFTMDDDAAVRGHPAVRGDAPWHEVFVREYWGRPLGQGWSSSYRPLVSLTFAVEQRVAPGPLLPRAINLLLFLGLLWLLLRWLAARVGTTRAAWSVAAFAALPLLADNVASIVGRADLLATIFGLLALFAALRGRGLAAAAAYLAALLCKESVALLPAIAAWSALLAWRRGRLAPRAAVHAVLALCATGLAYLLARQALLPVGLPPDFVGADNPFAAVHGAARAFANLGLVERYVEQTLLPHALCVDHTYADVMPPEGWFGADAWRSWLGALLLVGVARDALLAWRGESEGWWVAAALAYLVVGGWVVDLSVTFAERLAIWPLAFCVLAVSEGAKVSSAPWLRAAAAVLLLAYALSAASHAREWTDRVGLHRASVERCPAAVHNRLNLATELLRRRQGDDVAEALWHLAVAAAGQHRYPARLDLPAFAAERTESLGERLHALPARVQAPDARRWWAGFLGMIAQRGDAELLALARAARGTP